VSSRLAHLLQAAGLPADATPAPTPTPADAHVYLLERVTETLRETTPEEFRRDVPFNPAVRQWVDAFVADPAGAGSLLLVGNLGTGKTHQAWQALRYGVVGCYRRRVRPTWAVVKHRQFNAVTRPAPNNAHEAALARYCEVDLLLFDDLGASMVSDWGHDALHALIDARTEHRRPTLWTSNLADDEWSGRFDDRLLDRINVAGTAVFEGDSFRGAR
jgi:DNA replication protein DnaC